MKRIYLLSVLLLLRISSSFGQSAEISTTTPYQQNFDVMGSAGVATLPAGWKIERMTGETGQRIVGTYSNAVGVTMYRGGANMSATAKNGTYNFGAGDSITSTDRALGGSTTGATTSTQGVNFYLRLKNTGVTNINSLTVSYDIEKYRTGSNPAGFCIQMYTSPDGITWTSAGTDFYSYFAADASTAGSAIVPIQTVSVSKSQANGLAAGADLYIAWNYSVASGTSSVSAQELALDNVVISSSTVSTGLNSSDSKDISYNDGILQVYSDEIQNISVYSSNGARLITDNHCKTIDLNNLNSGVYIVSVLNRANQLKQIKIVK